VRHLAEAMSSDRTRFAKFFHGCLEDGVYFAPSQFEAGFLSTAHTPADLEIVAAVVEKNLARVF
jgi:glutamate-1-semialdehyde 2,1-aminomutase